MRRNLVIGAVAAALAAPVMAHGPQAGGGGTGAGMGMMGGGTMGQGMMGGGGMMGQGMMGGGGMMGPGMMGGYPGVELSAEQRSKMAEIRRETSRKHWELMGRMHDEHFHMHDLLESGKVDEAEARKSYDAMSAAHKQMFETMLEARKRMDAVLTDSQREQLRGGRRSGSGG